MGEFSVHWNARTVGVLTGYTGIAEAKKNSESDRIIKNCVEFLFLLAAMPRRRAVKKILLVTVSHDGQVPLGECCWG